LVESIDDIDDLDFSPEHDLSYTTQTTLSVDDTQVIVDALKEKFPQIQSPKKDDICYATQNRQDAVKAIIKMADVLLVLGSKNSSNSNRLREIAEKSNKASYLIDGAADIDRDWLKNCQLIGVTAGASAPEVLVQEVVSYLLDYGADEVIEVSGVEEDVHFPVPSTLR
jgi:4-hydroxy-3-methylbut-2-enyl diphosphate reductase